VVAQRKVRLGYGNACPSGYNRITDPNVCLAALEIAGEQGADFWGAEDAARDWPAGCYYCKNVGGCEDGTWFNPHPTGSAKGNARLWCEKGLTPIVTGQLLLVGDSDVDYWPSTHNAFPGSYDLGYGGYTCNNLLGEDGPSFDFQAALSTFKPSQVFLICGENDIDGGGASADVTFARLQQVVEMIRASGARLFMMGTKPEPQFAQPNTANLLSTYQAYDVMVQGLAASLAASAGTRSLPPLVVYDSYNSLIDLCNPYSFYQSDLFHLSAPGYSFVEAPVKAMLADTSGCQVWRSGVCVQGPSAQTVSASRCVDAISSQCTSLSGLSATQLQSSCVGATLSACSGTCCYQCSSASTAVDVKIGYGNACPSGYNRIATQARCTAAMAYIGSDYASTYHGAEDAAGDWPAGCYYCKNVGGCDDGTWFNPHPTGSAKGNARLWCEKGLP